MRVLALRIVARRPIVASPDSDNIQTGNDDDEALGLLRVEKEFSRKHLEAWLPKFGNKIREYDRLGFFRGLADLTEGWVAFDYQQHLQDGPLSAAAGITEG